MKRVLLALLAVTLACVVGAQAQQWPEENHYKVYLVDPPQPYDAPIQLNDQFGGYYADHFMLEKFATPVAKNGEPILFQEVHQTWWALDLMGEGWDIVVDNQFGEQVWHVEHPRYLVLPARKYEPGPLLEHNHYLAYEAHGEPVGLDVHLADQFGVIDAIALEPLWFLNPVEKVTPDGVVYPILDPQAHLACYRIDPPMFYDIMVTAFDQFGTWEFVLMDHECLCVPSWKRQVVVTEQRTWTEIKAIYRD